MVAVAIDWNTIITIAFTQAISTVTTFYTLKALNKAHTNGHGKETPKE